MLAAATTQTPSFNFSNFLHQHGHALLLIIAVIVLAVIAAKIIQHLAVVAALLVVGGIALIVLFPGLRQQLPFLKKAEAQVISKAELLQRREACNTLSGNLKQQCLARVAKLAAQAKTAATQASAKK